MIDSRDPYLQLAQAVVNKAIEDWAFYRIKTFGIISLDFLLLHNMRLMHTHF